MYLEVALQILYVSKESGVWKYYYLAPKDIFIFFLLPTRPENAARQLNRLN